MSNYERIMEAAAQYIAEEKPCVSCPEDTASILRPILQNKKQEEMWAILLNAKNRVEKIYMVTMGLADRSQCHAREMFREAIINNASRIILAHNHPSGDPTPSPQDITMTRSMIEAGKIIGIEVIDHIIMGLKTSERHIDHLSFRNEGLI
jgi:DNA repair protein RadC